MKKMSKSQRRRASRVDEFVELALQRGLSTQDLAKHVTGLLGFDKSFASKINEAGLTAQINFLLDAKNEGWLRKVLESSGSILDGFVMGFSSDPEELKKTIGRNNIDENGDVK